jgi:hypothetical protein
MASPQQSETPEADVPLPFVAGTNIQYAWDSTSLSYLKTCARLYQYVMIDGYVPQSGSENVHLRFGGEFHKAVEEFEHHRASGAGFEPALEATVHSLLIRIADWEPEGAESVLDYKNKDSLVATVIWYLDYYRDSHPTFILDNGRPAVELSFQFALDYGPAEGYDFTLCGHLDQVIDFNDELFVLDHKTTKTTPGSYYFDNYNPNNQMSLYTIAGEIILGSPIKGVIIDVVQLMKKEPNRFVRGFTFRTKDQNQEWLDNLASWFTLAQYYAEQDFWPMNDTACDKFGGCRFREVCSKSPQVRDIYLRSNYKKLPLEERWNPLKPR